MSNSELTSEQILEVFPDRGSPVTVKDKWIMLGSPKTTADLVAVAKKDLPVKYDSKEAAQRAGAQAGIRSAHMLAKAAVACYANVKGMKPGSKLVKLEKDFDKELGEFFALMGLKRPGIDWP